MQSNISKFLKNTITIYRLDGTRDGFAGKDMNWDKKYWDVRCRIYTAKGSYGTETQGKRYDITNKLMCETDVDIQMGDKIVGNSGRTFIVVRTDIIYKTTVAHHIEATLARIAE